MTTTAPPGAAWLNHAACAGQDTELWFPDQPNGSTAIKICRRRCPVRAECLYDALQHETPSARFGIRGGLTTHERACIPALPRSKPAAIAALRELLAPAPDTDPPAERTDPPMTTAPTINPSMLEGVTPALAAGAELVTISTLLRWAEDHSDPDVQDQGARAEAALTGLRTRYAADQELAAITDEATKLERRLAELRAREAELVPAKPKKPRRPVDYPAAEVRAWAEQQGIECPAVGRVPKRVLDAWRASLPQAG